MQTFLPYSNFWQSAECLDYRRLGKQRVEAYQILNTLQGKSKGWKNHPAVSMWKGYQDALKMYMNVCILTWMSRGYKNTMQLAVDIDFENYKEPPWLGNPEFHASHRSNLLRKNEEFYRKLGWLEPTDLEYIWPST